MNRLASAPALLVLALAMMAIGVDHFVNPLPFIRIVPAWLPAHAMLVYVSGAFEILGGAGLLVRRTRRWAAFGLVALYLAVFPANVNMAMHDIPLQAGNAPLPQWMLWARLPLQAVLIAWALVIANRARRDGATAP